MDARTQYSEVKNVKVSFVGDPGKTKQGDAKECDINFIMRRFERTGRLPDMIVKDPRYGDYSDVPTYQEALDIVRFAQKQFANLDPKLRSRFDNDASKFLEFCGDSKNEEEMEKLGLLNQEAKERRIAAKKAASDAEAARVAAEKAKAEADLIAKVKASL